MKQTLENVIKSNSNGLFLLDPPTGFGKTTSVIEIIKDFLSGSSLYSKVKKIFFVTNLKTNLPILDLSNELNEEEKGQCFQAKATIDYILDRFSNTKIDNAEIMSSKEYKNLKKDIDAYHAIQASLKNDESNYGLRNSLAALKDKISLDTEREFRDYIKSNYLSNKSIADRNEFINSNGWLKFLYPICDLEKYKVIFLTTKKFISPIDTFRRLPFYAYNDEITKDSIVFIDEFDSTKDILLNQIVEDGLKNRTDLISLFLDIHFALDNIVLPKGLLYTSEYHKKKVESGEWHTPEWHYDHWRDEFTKIYEKHNLKYVLKSVNFEDGRAFLYDDGKYFNVFKDSSKKFIYVELDTNADFLSLKAKEYTQESMPINYVLRDIEYCIDGFIEALFYIYNNYLYYKNEGKKSYEIKYRVEEAIYTVLDALNLKEEQKQFIYSKIQRGDFIFNKPQKDAEMRHGFNFTEIEDSNYHDIKSIVRNYNFPTTPEDAIIRLVNNALVVGISATAKVNTCIGNYDSKYLRGKLKDRIIEIDAEDQCRISQHFNDMTEKLLGQYQIHAKVVDNFNCFTDRERSIEMINLIFKDELKEKYIEILNNKKTKVYYFLIELKLAYIYKEIFENDIYSFIAFINRFPKAGEDLDSDRLTEMFDDLNEQNNYSDINIEIVDSKEFDYRFNVIKEKLSNGERVFVITTYQTIGSGKNIQYQIPESQMDRVIIDATDTRGTKDFEGVYLLTPTNLIQTLYFDSESKYNDLSKYLFQQEYLYQNKHLIYPQMKSNISNAFRKTFFGENNIFYTRNNDLNLHTLKISVQAVGRICRCRNKNKNIYVYADYEVVERVQEACITDCPKLMNEEFKALLDIKLNPPFPKEILQKFSQQSKEAYKSISKAAHYVKYSKYNVTKWQDLREFVLKNPTCENPGEYEDYYFKFEDKVSGYSFKKDKFQNIIDLRISPKSNMQYVSEDECELPIILSIGHIKEFFQQNKYASTFKKAHYIMSPSLYQQVYLGALGEIAGKFILEKELGYDLNNLDADCYEFFDYKKGNVYFDFKNWDKFVKDNDEYVKKIEWKLGTLNGSKCFVINLLKRADSPAKINISENVIQIPYLFDGEIGEINFEAINYIRDLL